MGARSNWLGSASHLALRNGLSLSQFLFAAAIFACILGYAWFHDVHRGRIIPNYITLPLIAASAAFAPFIYKHPWQLWLSGVLLPLFIFLFGVTMSGKFGMGDVKLLTAFAFLLGPGVLIVLIVSAFIGIAWSLPTVVRYFRQPRPNSKSSFPWRLFAALAVVFAGAAALMLGLVGVAHMQVQVGSATSKYGYLLGFPAAAFLFFLAHRLYRQHRRLRPLQQSVLGEAIPFGPSIIIAFPVVLYLSGAPFYAAALFLALTTSVAQLLRFFAAPLSDWWQRVQSEVDAEIEQERAAAESEQN